MIIKKVKFRSSDVKQIYFDTFPKKERMPFSMMVAMSKLWNTDFLSFYDGDTFCGFIYLAHNRNIIFVMFFAVDEKLRSKGYGSTILQEIQKKYPKKKIIISIEPCDETAPDIETRKRRKDFYLRNGYKETGYMIKLSGVVQEIIIANGEFKKHNITKETNVRNMKAAIEKDKRRIAEIDTMIERLYEDNVLGKIPDDRFSKMMGKYEAEQKTLIEAVAKAEHSLKVFEQDKVDLRIFLETIRKCTDINELTPEIVNRLIKRIEVHKSAKVDGRKRVKLDVYFTAAGLIDIPDENKLREMMEEIRKSA